MFTLFTLYMIFYLLSYISLFYTLRLVFNNGVSVNIPLTQLTNLSLKYNKLSKFLLLLLLSLSGLPPFSFFLVKFTFLQQVYIYATHLVQLSTFTNFSVAAFFYLQFYNSLNKRSKNYKPFSHKSYRFPMLVSGSAKFAKAKYRLTRCLYISFYFLFFTIFMYIDFFIFFYNNGI